LLVAGVDFYLSTVIFALVAFTLIRSTRARLRLRHVAGAAADKVATSEY
jgi:hypothetical protein